MMIRTRRRAAVALLGLALCAGACGSSSKSSSSSSASTTTVASTSSGPTTSSTGGNAALCSAREQLKTSIQDLTNIDILKNGTSGIQAALTKVKTNLEAVKSAASAQMQPQVKAFEDSLQSLQTAVTNGSGVTAIVSAAQDAATTGSALLTALDQVKC
jgi:hypothetical protein